MYEYLFNNINDILQMLVLGIPLNFMGVFLGQVFGALPGFSGSNALVVLLPFILSLSSAHAIMFMVAVYVGVRCGGGFTAVLTNIPGTGSDVVATFDGYPLSQQGKGAYALGVNIMASSVGAFLTAIMVFFLAPSFARAALKFGPKEMTVLILLAIIIVGQLLAKDTIKGWIAGCFGFLLGTMGLCTMFAVPRGNFGSDYLIDGLPLIPAVVGLFAITEVMFLMHQKAISSEMEMTISRKTVKQLFEGVRDTLRHWKDVTIVSLVGMFIGILPGAGANIASFVCYNVTTNLAKDKSMFGKGDIRGIIAAEAGDNAAASGALVPMMALGVPGSSTTAIMLVVLTYQGVVVGPRLFTNEPLVAFSILIGLLIASVFVFITGCILTGFASKITVVSTKYLIPGIVGFAAIGAMAQRGYIFDLGVALVFGLIGYMGRLRGFPPAGIIIGIVLGPLLEAYFMRSMRIGEGNPMVFFQGPIVITLWGIMLMVICLPFIKKHFALSKNKNDYNIKS